MSKVPCKNCGALIMELTFKNNGGLCMPCAKGYKCSRCGKSTLSGQAGLCSDCFRESTPPSPPDRTAFDHNLMLNASLAAIKRFAESHTSEVFYGFAIDASMLCLNSLEEHKKTLSKYEKSWPEYRTDPQQSDNLKMNTGDWAYQGFFDLTGTDGFCQTMYNDHYNQAAENLSAAQTSPYAKAMDRLLDAIEQSGVLGQLKCTDGLTLRRVEHDY